MISNKPTSLQYMGIACTTSIICVNVTHPVEMIKTRFQINKFNMKYICGVASTFAM